MCWMSIPIFWDHLVVLKDQFSYASNSFVKLWIWNWNYQMSVARNMVTRPSWILNRVRFEIPGEFITLLDPYCELTISISAPSFNSGAQYLYPPKSIHVHFRDLLGQYCFQDFFIDKYNHINSKLLSRCIHLQI